MDIQAMLKMMHDARKSSATNLTIGEMLNKLNQFDDDENVVFTNEMFFDGTWGSYRGYYEDMYIGCRFDDKGLNTVGNIKNTLMEALETGIMEGYKGGEYSVNNDTLVWFARYGSTGDMIVDVKKLNGTIFIITKEDKWG